MQGAIVTLVLTIGAALVGFLGVPEPMEGLVRIAFFSLLVVFVFLMVRALVEDR